MDLWLSRFWTSALQAFQGHCFRQSRDGLYFSSPSKLLHSPIRQRYSQAYPGRPLPRKTDCNFGELLRGSSRFFNSLIPEELLEPTHTWDSAGCARWCKGHQVPLLGHNDEERIGSSSAREPIMGSITSAWTRRKRPRFSKRVPIEAADAYHDLIANRGEIELDLEKSQQ